MDVSITLEPEELPLKKSPTPDTRKEIIKHKIELEDKKYNDHWDSSCGRKIDRRAVQYFTQLGMSITVMSFCFYNLVAFHDDCSSTSLYSGILSLIVGLYIPSPTMKK